jgi:hypothetical protein
MEKAYKASRYYSQMKEERAAYRKSMEADGARRETFLAAFKDEKRKLVGHKSPFTVSFGVQVYELFKRQVRLTWQDRLGLIVLFATSIIIALIVGSCYLDLPQTSQSWWCSLLGSSFPLFHCLLSASLANVGQTHYVATNRIHPLPSRCLGYRRYSGRYTFRCFQ